MKTLYGLDSKGKVRQWSVDVIDNPDGTATMRQLYGYVGGKIAVRDHIVKKGKNIGKSNSTTPYTQAFSQAESKIEEKYHENYVDYIPDPATFQPPYMLPQLAQGVGKGKIKYPAAIQPKLNGICCMARKNEDDSISYHSRGGQIFNFIEHLTGYLKELMDVNEVFHGELYNHDWSLQKIGSCVKKMQEYNPQLEFWVYDCAHWIDGRPVCRNVYNDRYINDCLVRLISINTHMIGHPETLIVNNYEEAKTLHDKFVSQGFEGAVLKNLNGIYQFEHRSENLEKIKDYKDAEFEIVGCKEDVDGCCVFKCKTDEGKVFEAKPKGTIEKRKQYLLEIDSLIGKKLTVKFFEWSDDNIPLQPVAEIVRDYE